MSRGFGVEGRISRQRRTWQHFVVSARPVWVRNYLTPTFSCTQCAKGAPARGLEQSRWTSVAILVSGQEVEQRLATCARLRFWKLTGLAVEVKSCLMEIG